LTSRDDQTVRAAYISMDLVTWYVIVPLALASLLSGVISSLGTAWGLFRYYWVVVKLLITVVATLILLVHTQSISLLAGAARTAALSPAQHHSPQVLMLVASGAALLVLLALTALSIYKPRGMTAYGWRKQQEQRTASQP
ncbi:MAG: hypothetical protein M3154_08870, partial [Candidatus Eremiobacteraeota bacterium]|nr:hypothetical protein [Candidatus Eremiobacteraeota bacterium]